MWPTTFTQLNAERKKNRQTNRETNRQTERQTDRQTDRHQNIKFLLYFAGMLSKSQLGAKYGFADM